MALSFIVVVALTASVLQPAASSPPQDTGVVYFFFTEASQPFGGFGQPSFWINCDGQDVAKLKHETFIGVRVVPGRHTFASKGFRSRIEETAIHLDVEAGSPIFVRLEPILGGLKNFAHLRVVSETEGRLMVSTLAPAAPSLIKRPEMIATTLVSTPRPGLTNDDVFALKNAGIGDAVVVLKIRQSAADYDVSEAALGTLRRAGVSDAVVEAMVEASRRREPDQ